MTVIIHNGNRVLVPNVQAAIEAEEEEKQALKIKNRAEMEKMLAANQDLHERKAQRISEELDVSDRREIFRDFKN